MSNDTDLSTSTVMLSIPESLKEDVFFSFQLLLESDWDEADIYSSITEILSSSRFDLRGAHYSDAITGSDHLINEDAFSAVSGVQNQINNSINSYSHALLCDLP